MQVTQAAHSALYPAIRRAYRMRHLLRGKLELRRRRRRDAVIYEQVIVYDDRLDIIYRVAVPLPLLYERLGHSARYINDSKTPRYIGAITAFVAAMPLIGGPLLLLGMNLVIVAFIAMAIGFMAMLPGWMIAPRWGPQPQWLASRSVDGEIEAFDLEAYFSQDDPEASFIAEMLALRDVRQILAGGRSKTATVQLTATVILVMCLVVALFFFVIVFSDL